MPLGTEIVTQMVNTAIGIPPADPFGDCIKCIIDGEKIWADSSVTDLGELEAQRQRLAHEIFAGAELVDLVAHSTPIKCYLKLGDWVLEPEAVKRLASYFPESVKIVRLIGCNTASTQAGCDAAVAFTQSSLRAYGTLNKVYSTHFDKGGVKKGPGAPPMRAFFPTERDPGPLPTSSGMPDRNRSRVLLAWLRGAWRAISGLYRVFIRLLPERWTLYSRIWERLRPEGEPMPGLLTEPLFIFAIKSRVGIWTLEILFDFEYARFYPSVGTAEERNRVYGIRGFGRMRKTPLEAYLERWHQGVTLIARHEEAGNRCSPVPPGENGDAGLKLGRKLWLVLLGAIGAVILLVLLALSAYNGGTPLEVLSPAHDGGTSPPNPLGKPTDDEGEPSGCASLPPTKTYEGFVNGYTSPQVYDSATCHHAISIQIDNYSSSYVGDAIGIGGTLVSWADAVPTSKTACEEAWVQADLYRQISGRWTLVSSKQGHGEWHGEWIVNRCLPPRVGWRNIEDDPNVLIPNSNYRIVSMARTSPSGATRRFRAYSDEDSYVVPQ